MADRHRRCGRRAQPLRAPTRCSRCSRNRPSARCCCWSVTPPRAYCRRCARAARVMTMRPLEQAEVAAALAAAVWQIASDPEIQAAAAAADGSVARALTFLDEDAWRCASARSANSTACPRSTPGPCTRWAMRSPASISSRSRPSSNRQCLAVAAPHGGNESELAASRNWPGPGSGSIRRRRMPPSTIWSESRWFSASSACLRRPRAVDTYPPSMAGPSRPSTSLCSKDNPKCPANPITSPRRSPIRTAPPHIGHAYEAIATDAIARFMRLDGMTCSSSPGPTSTAEDAADRGASEGLTPRQLLDRNVPLLRGHGEDAELLERRLHPHHRAAPPPLVGSDLASAWKRTATSISTNMPAGIRCATRPITPRTKRALNDRRQRIAPQTGTPVEWVEEESYFFRLSAYQDKLLDALRADPNYVLPQERLNEVASFVKAACRISRSRAPPSTGASGARQPTATSCMCGSTR